MNEKSLCPPLEESGRGALGAHQFPTRPDREPAGFFSAAIILGAVVYPPAEQADNESECQADQKDVSNYPEGAVKHASSLWLLLPIDKGACPKGQRTCPFEQKPLYLSPPARLDRAMQAPLILMIHETRAWLCRGDWNRPVEGHQFVAWASYAGIELRSIEDSKSQLVVLSTLHQERLFELMWVSD